MHKVIALAQITKPVFSSKSAEQVLHGKPDTVAEAFFVAAFTESKSASAELAGIVSIKSTRQLHVHVMLDNINIHLNSPCPCIVTSFLRILSTFPQSACTCHSHQRCWISLTRHTRYCRLSLFCGSCHWICVTASAELAGIVSIKYTRQLHVHGMVDSINISPTCLTSCLRFPSTFPQSACSM